MAKTFDVKTMSGSRVRAKMAGTESTANTTSLASRQSSATRSGVAQSRPSRRTRKRCPCNSGVTGSTRRSEPDQRVALGVHPLLGGAQHAQPRDDEEAPEEPHHPVELHEDRAQGDEDPPEDQRAQDPVEEHPVLVSRGHAKVAEDQDEHEDVVHRQRVLDHVAGEELERDLPGGRLRVEARDRGQPRISRERPGRVGIERGIEDQGEADPCRAPPHRLPEAHLVGVAVQQEEVDDEEEQHASREGRVQPPVLLERKERGHRVTPLPSRRPRTALPRGEADAPVQRRSVRRATGGVTRTAQPARATTRSWMAPRSRRSSQLAPSTPTTIRSAPQAAACSTILRPGSASATRAHSTSGVMDRPARRASRRRLTVASSSRRHSSRARARLRRADGRRTADGGDGTSATASTRTAVSGESVRARHSSSSQPAGSRPWTAMRTRRVAPGTRERSSIGRSFSMALPLVGDGDGPAAPDHGAGKPCPHRTERLSRGKSEGGRASGRLKPDRGRSRTAGACAGCPPRALYGGSRWRRDATGAPRPPGSPGVSPTRPAPRMRGRAA